MPGKVKIIKEEGYGYIILDDMDSTQGRDVFFHAKDVQDDRFGELKVGDGVLCHDVVRNAKGYHCVCVEPV